MRITPLEAWTSAAVAAVGVVALALAVAYLWHTRRGNRGPGRHVLGRPRFDGDPGGWGEAGPKATLATLPPPYRPAAPLPGMAETHADIFGVPTPKYTVLGAWQAEDEAAERLAETSDRLMVADLIRGLEYRGTVDVEAGQILERTYAELARIDIRMGLS